MTTSIDLTKVKRVLVAKLRHHGDVLLTSPVFSVLKTYLPNAQIDAYLYEETAPMLSSHPAIYQMILYSKKHKKKSRFKGFLHELKVLKTIYQNKYDLVINLTEGDRGALAAFISMAPYKVGFDPEGSGFLGKRNLYTHVVKICRSLRHTVERNLDALRCIGIFPTPEERDLIFHIPTEDFSIVSELLQSYEMEKTQYIVIHPVSRWLFKCWPEKSFTELIQKLLDQGEKIILTASSDSEELAINQRILSTLQDKRVIDLSGKTTLKQLGALIHGAKMLICVDSVPLHLASALKTPVVAIFGPTSDVTWAPWKHSLSEVVAEAMTCRPCYMPGCGGSKKSDCLEQLSVAKVEKAIHRLLLKTKQISSNKLQQLREEKSFI